MRKFVTGVLTLAAVAALSLPSIGQVAVGSTGSVVPGRNTRPQRLPYTAEFKTTRVQTLPDGSTITHETTDILARDSQGRSYNFSSGTSIGDEQREYTNVNIQDPVAKTHTFWSTPGQRVFVTNTPDGGAMPPSCTANTPAPMTQPAEAHREKPKNEDLGKQTFEGVEAQGHRTTWTFAPGAIGNSDLLIHTSEVWFSTTPGLEGINVRQVNDDPRSGKETRELVKFTQGEPDAALFQPPQDFPVQIQEIHNEVRCQ